MFTRLRSDIQCILDRDPAARSKWEVITCYPGLHALVLHRLAHWFWSRGLRWLGRFTSQFSRWLTGIEIHPGAKIADKVFIDHGMGVVIGETAEIGEGCTIYQGVTLGGTSLDQGRQAPSHPGPQRGHRGRCQGAGRLHRGRRRERRLQRGGDQAGAGRRHGGGHPGARDPGRRQQAARAGRQQDGLLGLRHHRERRPAVAGDEGPDRQRVVAGAPDRAAVAGHRKAVRQRARKPIACPTTRP